MIEVRPFETLGGADHGWLKTKHHFSFADYYDPARTQWGTLRVWNDDEIAPQAGFPPHPHADMEIITYVREGAVSHEDSMGNRGRTVAGDVQVMSAGRGLRHAEYNREAVLTTLFQIWILPETKGGAPSWGTKAFPKNHRAGRFVTLASGVAGDHDALPIRANARVFGATLKAGGHLEYEFTPDRHLYLVPATGLIEVNGLPLRARAGAAITQETALKITALAESELVLVDAA